MGTWVMVWELIKVQLRSDPHCYARPFCVNQCRAQGSLVKIHVLSLTCAAGAMADPQSAAAEVQLRLQLPAQR